MNYLVFDIGGTSVKYALSDQLGNLSHTGFFPTPGTNAKSLLQSMDDVRLRIGGKQPIDGASRKLSWSGGPGDWCSPWNQRGSMHSRYTLAGNAVRPLWRSACLN